MKKLYSYSQFVNEEVEPQSNQGQPIQTQIQKQPQPQGQPQSEPVQDSGQIQKQPNQELQINTGLTSDYKKPVDPRLVKFASIIDYTCLKPGATKDDVNKTIQDAVDNKFCSVVVPYDMVDHAAYTIDEGKIKVVSVIDYPDGDAKESDKLFQAIELISNGADEIDMVMDWQALKGAYEEEDGEDQESSYYHIEKEIKVVADECHKNGVILKVICESGELTIEQVAKACQLIANAGADFVMTSTGTKNKGAELDKVKEMRRILPEHIKIKVSGGIRTLADCEMYYQYVDRIGTSVIPK